MKRRRLSSSCSNNGSEGVLYAVFDVVALDDALYHIYKLNSVAEKKENDDDDVHKIGKPIEILRSSKYPSAMSFFSVGSKLYFCGGVSMNRSHTFDPSLPIYESKAYMLDINSNQGIVSIPSMNSPKHIPLVFGPVENHKFYIFSAPQYVRLDPVYPTFEMLDTLTNEWKNIHVPPSVGQEKFHTASTLCGSNILLSDWYLKRLFVFCTRSETWRTISDPSSGEHTRIPFMQAHPLYFENIFGHFLLAYDDGNAEVYLSRNFEDYGLDQVDPFEYVSGLSRIKKRLDNMPPQFLGDWGIWNDFFPFKFNHGNSICVARSAEPGVTSGMRLVIDIFHVSYSLKEGTRLKLKVKVKVNNASRYKYRSKVRMEPRHFFVVS